MKLVNPVPPLVVAKVPVIPVDNGNPVALVNVAAEGVPKFGVTRTGELERTTSPVPVDVVTPVPPEVTGIATLNVGEALTNNKSAALSPIVVFPEVVSVVNAPVFGVVAPTVPLCAPVVLPVKFDEIVVAEKLPDASRSTKVLPISRFVYGLPTNLKSATPTVSS